MEPDPPKEPPVAQTDARLKIYFLPNLMTAGGLVFGVRALSRMVAAAAEGLGGWEFMGFPIAAAAGMVALLTLFMMWWNEKEFAKGNWRYLLPVIMLFLSWMMVSEVKYPTFKKLDLRATRTFTKTLIAILFIGSVLILREKVLVFVLPLFLTSYLVSRFIRPRLSP